MRNFGSRARVARIFSSIAAVAALAVSCTLSAADLYECKSANSPVAFQNEPCTAAQKTLGHYNYQREPDAPASQPDYAPQSTRTSRSGVIVPHYAAQLQQVPPQPVAYQCTAGQRSWVQYSPCPATYTHGVPVEIVDGTTTEGQEVSGSGWAQEEAPVQQQPLDNQQLCAQLGNSGARIPHSGQSDVYERNVARSKYCGH